MITTISVILTNIYSSYRKQLSRLNGEPQSFQFDVTNWQENADVYFQVATPNGNRDYQFEVLVTKRGLTTTYYSTSGHRASLKLKIEKAPADLKIVVNLPSAKKDVFGRYPHTIFAVESFRRQQFDKIA